MARHYKIPLKSKGNILVPVLVLIALSIIAILTTVIVFSLILGQNNRFPTTTPTLSPAPTPILKASNWESYTNNFFDFAFDYPPGYRVWNAFTENSTGLTVYLVTDKLYSCFKKAEITDYVLGALNDCGYDSDFSLLEISINKNISFETNLETWVINNNQTSDPAGDRLSIAGPINTDSLENGLSYHNPHQDGGKFSWAFINLNQQYVVEFISHQPIDTNNLNLRVIDSFKFLNKRQTLPKPQSIVSFDDCKDFSTYAKASWMLKLKEKMNDYNLSYKNIIDVCVSLDNTTVIWIGDARGPKVYQYNVRANIIEQAVINDKGKYTFGVNPKFGKQSENIIPITMGYGDAGCISSASYGYDFTQNIVNLEKSENYCIN